MPSPPSAIWDLQVDDTLDQDADYEFDDNDRQYIDHQIIGLQTHVVGSLLSGYAATWMTLDSSSAAVAIGSVVCVSGANCKLATTSAITDAGQALGVVVTAAAPGAKVRVAMRGTLPPSITGLGQAAGVAVVSATGGMSVVSVPSGTQYPVGTVNSAGYLTLSPTSPPVAGVASYGKINLSLANGTNSNVATDGSLLQVIGGPTAAFALGSVRPSAALLGGQPVVFEYAGGQPWSLVHQDTAATGSSLKLSIVGQTTAGAQVMVFGKVTAHYDGTNLLVNLGSQYKHDWSIQDFGGSASLTDNAAAYAACNAFMASIGGGVVRFPVGTFRSSTAYVPANNTVTVGVSKFATILARTTPGSVVYRFVGINVSGGVNTGYVLRDIGVTNTTTRTAVANNTTYSVGQIVRPTASKTCRWLQCTTAGTTPASGPEPIGQLYAGTNTVPTINVTGTPASAGVVLEVFIEGSLTTFGYSVAGGAAPYQASGVAFTPGGTVALTGAAAGLTLHFSTGTYKASSLNDYVYASPPFGWSLIPGVSITWGTAVFEVIDAGGGFEEIEGANNSYQNCAAQNVEHGWIVDGSENIEIVNPYYGCVSFSWWICNGPDHLPTTTDVHGNLSETQATNVINIYGQPNSNSGGGFVDDGGINHNVIGLAAGTSSWITGVDKLHISGAYYEGSGPVATVAFKSFYGGQPYGLGQAGLVMEGFFNCGSLSVLTVLEGMIGGLGRACIDSVTVRGTYPGGGTAAIVGAQWASNLEWDVHPVSGAFTHVFDTAPSSALANGPGGAVQRCNVAGAMGTNLGANLPASVFDFASTFALRSASVTVANGVNTSATLDVGAGADSLRPAALELSGPTGAFSVSGLPGGGAPGRVTTLYYYGTQACTIKNEDSTDEATAVNRIHTMTGADITLAAGQFVARFWWSATLSRWVYG